MKNEEQIDWRIPKSNYVKGIINEMTKHLVGVEIDIKNLQSRLIVEALPAVAEKMQIELAQKKNQRTEISAVLRASEDLLVDYAKDESQLRN